VFNPWLAGFKIYNPTEYFLEVGNDDTELQCNIQTEFEFLLSTLELFGLPVGYMDGKGHYADWGKTKDERTARKNKKKAKGANATIKKLRQKKGFKDAQEETPPTHFDLAPILKALKRLLACSPEERSNIRTIMTQDRNKVRSIFTDEYQEPSFKKCVDIDELAKKLADAGIQIS